MTTDEGQGIYRLGWPITGVVIAILMALSTGCYEMVEPVCDGLPAEGLDRIEVQSDGGSVELRRVEGAEFVELEGEIHIVAASMRSAGRQAEDITLEFYAEGNTAMLILEIPPEVQPAWGELILTVPEGFSSSIETTNAPVTVEGLDGDLRVETTNGKVTVTDVNGAVKVETTNGQVTVTGVNGAVGVESTNGAVTLTDIRGDLVGGTTNGKVSVTGHVGNFDLDTTNAAIDLDSVLPDGGYGYAASTNGSIELALPADISATLEARTTNGSIDIDEINFDGQLHDDWASVIFGDGAGEIVLSTTNGSIQVAGP
jgi:hypothetical protein